MWMQAPTYGIFDGQTEVHTVTLSREVLEGFRPADGLWPSEWLPADNASGRVDPAEQAGRIDWAECGDSGG